MGTKRRISIYSAGCAVCQETVKLVERIVCQSCEVTVLDMQDDNVAVRAKALGIHGKGCNHHVAGAVKNVEGNLAKRSVGPDRVERELAYFPYDISGRFTEGFSLRR